jgi:hypothetical protein
MSQIYELRPFDTDGKQLATIERWANSDAAIIGQAGTMAKANDGPVDIARAGDVSWDERYLTTASPSKIHAKGFRTERLT